jgi:hypothetical protein
MNDSNPVRLSWYYNTDAVVFTIGLDLRWGETTVAIQIQIGINAVDDVAFGAIMDGAAGDETNVS